MAAQEKRKTYDADRNRSRISLCERIDPWRKLRNDLNFTQDKELAEFLIQCYLSGRNNASKWYVCLRDVNICILDVLWVYEYMSHSNMGIFCNFSDAEAQTEFIDEERSGNVSPIASEGSPIPSIQPCQ